MSLIKKMMFQMVILTAVLGAAGYAEVGSNWIEQWGIRWTFDKPLSLIPESGKYQYGQFANGDYWVIGPVKIIRIDPQSIIVNEMWNGKTYPRIINGTMINPPTLDRTWNNDPQGYDSEMFFWHPTAGRVYSPTNVYNVSANAARYGDTQNSWTGSPISGEHPIEISSDSSIVSTISITPFPAGIGNATDLKTAAVLTVLLVAPQTGAFRPPYCGTNKQINFKESEIDYSALANLASVDGTPSIITTTKYFEKVWLDHIGSSGEPARNHHPLDNMPNYSRDMAWEIGEGVLCANLNFTTTQKHNLVVNLIQLGIDNYGVLQSSKYERYGFWWPQEGQGMGRKLPIVFAGRLLNNSSMLNVGTWWDSADCVQGTDGKWYMCIRSHTSSSSTQPITGADCATYWQSFEQIPGQYLSFPVERQKKNWVSGTQYGTGHVFQEDLNVFYVSGNDVNRYVRGVNKGAPFAVQGTDGNWYRCIQSHTASTNNRPITGEQWNAYWELTHSVPTGYQKTWSSGTAFTAHSGGTKAYQYSENHIGIPEWGTNHYGPYPAQMNDDADWDTANYRGIAIAGMAGQAMAIHVMGLKDIWKATAFLDFMDRWYYMTTPPGSAYVQSQAISPFVKNMWATYRANYGPVWPNTGGGTTPTTYTLSITAANGSVTKSPNKTSYSSGEVVTLTATPNTGYTFGSWAGDATGTTNPVTITMNGNKSVTANFTAIPYTLTTTANNGTITKSPSKTSYTYGETVTLTAAANSGYTFTGWVGDATGPTSPITITMNANKTVTAGFTQQQTQPVANDNLANATAITGLSGQTTAGNTGATKETGEPSHAGFPGGVSVWWRWTAPASGLVTIHTFGSAFDTLLAAYTGSAVASLTPIASNDDSSGVRQSQITFDAVSGTTYRVVVDGWNLESGNIVLNWNLSGTTPTTYTLSTTAANGTITKSPSKTSYTSGESVTLTAAPAAGYTFGSWTGGATGTTNPITITMNSNKTVTGNFTPNTYSIAIFASNGSVTKSPSKTTYTHGETVVLNAVPAAGYKFTGWTGGATGLANPITITMDANKIITANFAQEQYTLTNSATNGTISKSPSKTTYTYGETVTLTASANPGYVFTGWTGDLTGSAISTSITMNANKNIVANFASTTSSVLSLLNSAIAAYSDSASFDGVDDYKAISTAGWGLNGMTLSMWAKPDVVTGSRYLFGHTVGSWSNRIQLYIRDGQLGLGLGGTNAQHTNIHTCMAGQWVYIALSWNGTNYSVYVNNQLKATGAYTGLTQYAAFADIGNTGNPTYRAQEPFAGTIDDVRIFNKILASAEQAALYNYERNGGLTAHLMFDDYAGTTASDISGSGNAATLVGDPVWGRAWAKEDYLRFTTGSQAAVVSTSAIRPDRGTVAMWVAPENLAIVKYFFGHMIDSTNRIALYASANHLAISLGNTSALRTGIAPLTVNTPYHIALTWDGANYAVYVNGVSKAVGTYTGLTQLAPTADIGHMGNPASRSSLPGFKGVLDDVRLYNRTLAADEINALFNTYDISQQTALAIAVSGPASYQASGLPIGASFISTSQMFTWRPWYSQSGDYKVSFTAAGQPTQNVTVSVHDVKLADWYKNFLVYSGKLN